MKHLFDQVSYQCSRNITSTYSTSFSLAVNMLSPKIRPAIHAIYGFVRLADEIVDTFHDYNKESLLNEFENDVKKAIERKISLNPILNSFQHAVHKYKIEYDLIEAFLRSMRADLHKRTYDTISAYEEYIYGSADVVGLMCLRVFVNGDEKLFYKLKYPAMKLGSAFQKVNFLRDIKEDTESLKRSYFPNVKDGNLENASKTEIIEEIKSDLEEAYLGIRQLPIEAKFGVYTAYIYYKKLLMKLVDANAEEIRVKRVRLSNPTKMVLLAKSFLNYKLNLIK
jgi:15-cis-phytoene synthase